MGASISVLHKKKFPNEFSDDVQNNEEESPSIAPDPVNEKLVGCLYSSELLGELRGNLDAAIAIVEAAEKSNRRMHIGGFILIDVKLERCTQYFEGEKGLVEALAKKIFADNRHKIIVIEFKDKPNRTMKMFGMEWRNQQESPFVEKEDHFQGIGKNWTTMEYYYSIHT